MFVIELVAGFLAGSASLQADSLDFLADTANYGISLFVVGMALRFRARAAFVKGLTMAAFGLWVLGGSVRHIIHGIFPEAATMGGIGVLALLANLSALGLLWAYQKGDSNMRSVWLCSRNDAIGNVAVLAAAAGVFGTFRGWPDELVSCFMGILALQGSWQVLQHASRDLREAVA